MIPPELFLNTILLVFLSNALSLILFAFFLQSYERTVQSMFTMIENIVKNVENNSGWDERDEEQERDNESSYEYTGENCSWPDEWPTMEQDNEKESGEDKEEESGNDKEADNENKHGYLQN